MKRRFDKLTLVRKTLFASLFLIGLLTMFGVSCQSTGPEPPVTGPGLPNEPTPGTQPIEVAIEGFAFKPADITVPVGSTVTWHNKDSVTHTVTARDKTFDSGNLSLDDILSYTFEDKGTFEYYCTIHPYMEGKVVVE